MTADADLVRLGLPKGRMQDNLFQLLAEGGVRVRASARGYRPQIAMAGFETKILKPQNIVEMLHHGSRDLGFAGHDWVVEKRADLVEVLDTGLDPVRIVAAAPKELLVDGDMPKGRFVIASEYVRVTQDWIEARGYDATFVRSYGATEVFPPEDADCIVDNTATGSTLRANGLEIFDTVMTSSTRLFANPRAMDNPTKRDRIEHLALLLKGVLDARRRVMVELNYAGDDLEGVIAVLPCMREPTIAQLHGTGGHALRAAVPREELAELIPRLKAKGATDIVVTKLTQIVP